MKIDYKLASNSTISLTICPHNVGYKVGSYNCQKLCPNFISIDKGAHFIECSISKLNKHIKEQNRGI